MCVDQKENAENKAQKEHASDVIELLTPVVKAYCAQRGFEVCVQAVQVFGGYGYIKEFPVEQLVRDVKIASIYEGTDGIQAMDFLGRKLGMKKGMVFKALLDEMGKTIADAKQFESLTSMAKSLGNASETLARFFIETVLPVTQGRMASVQALSDAALSMDEASFD